MPELAPFEQLDQAIDLLLSKAALLAGAPRPSAPADPAFAALQEIAAELCDLPDDRFKVRLAAELRNEPKRRTMSTPVTAAPAAIRSVTPMIDVPDGAKLIDFLKSVFDAEVTAMHAHGPDDAFHAFVAIGGAPILIGSGHARATHPAALHVFVKDCDAVYQRALDAGAVTLMPGVGEPADRPYGERSAFVKDAFENQYFIGTRLGSHYWPEGSPRVVPCLHPAKAAPLIDFLERAFGAQESDRVEMGGRLMHSFLRIGEATFELGESEQGARASAFYMEADDVDAVYHRAMAAGARSLLAPSDQSYGDRIAVVEDPTGNQWVPAKRIG